MAQQSGRRHYSGQELYGPCASIHERFPGLRGRLLWDCVMENYAEQHGITIHYYKQNAGGARKRCLWRHPWNNRDSRPVRKALLESVLENGGMHQQRSMCFVILPDLDFLRSIGRADLADPDFLLLLTYGHFTEAVYDAEEQEPENQQVRMTIQSGIPNVTSLNRRTPADVCNYVKETNNAFQGGAGTNLLERLEDIDAIETAWSAHCRAHSITVPDCPSTGPNRYATQYRRFVQTAFVGKFKTWESFESFKSFKHNLDALDLCPTFQRIFNTEVNFTHPLLNNDIMGESLHAVVTLLNSKFNRTIPKPDLDLIMIAAMKLCVPLSRRHGEHPAPWIIGNGGRHKAEVVALLLTPMEGSVIYRPKPKKVSKSGNTRGRTQVEAGAGDGDSDEDPKGEERNAGHVVEEAAGRGRGRRGLGVRARRASGKAMDETAQDLSVVLCDVPSGSTDPADSSALGKRQKLWLDEVYCMVAGALHGIAPKLIQQTTRRCTFIALHWSSLGRESCHGARCPQRSH